MTRAAPIVVALIVGALLAALLTKGIGDSRGQAEQERAVALYESQVASCERGNTIRWEVNERGELLKRYLALVSAAPGVPADVRTASARLARSVGPIELPVCADAFPRP